MITNSSKKRVIQVCNNTEKILYTMYQEHSGSLEYQGREISEFLILLPKVSVLLTI